MLSHTKTNNNNQQQGYWDKRYANQNANYEWYMAYDEIREEMLTAIPSLAATALVKLPHVDVDDEEDIDPASPLPPSQDAVTVATTTRANTRVLIVGCGNSTLSKQMLDDGFVDQESIDYSDTVVRQMKAMYGSVELKFRCMDVRKLDYSDATFDVIVDKGTLDAILCGADSGKNSASMLSECHRVLKRGGTFISVSYGLPDTRLPHFSHARYAWHCIDSVVAKTRYMYVCRDKKLVAAAAASSPRGSSSSYSPRSSSP
jgi:SAM-dependent methyltransferase